MPDEVINEQEPTAAAPRTHQQLSRGQVVGGQARVPESSLSMGRFGRLFRNLLRTHR